MAADFTIKAHDRMPAIQAAFTVGGIAVDLTLATSVKFIMATDPGGVVVINRPATIVTAAGGIVAYQWQAGDTATVGNYRAEWQVTWANGTQTFPTLTYHTIAILADLDNA